jgi:hypothetical protein
MVSRGESQEGFGALAVGIGIFLIFAAPVSGILTVLYWLRYGAWPDWSAAGFGFSAPITNWLGANNLLNEIYHIHLGIIVFFVGLGLVLIAGKLSDP